MPKASPEFLVLSFDIGTSSTRTALFDHNARCLPRSESAEQYEVSYGQDGRAELSPPDLLRAVTRALNRSLRFHRSLKSPQRLPIRALGGSALWHGLLGLNRSFRPITPVFTWADSRAAPDARKLRLRFDERKIQQTTGCMLRSTFWPAKLCWFRRTQPKLFSQVAYWASPSDWIFWNLFGDLGCSASMASGTGLFNLKTKTWDAELAQACKIEVENLPRITDRLEQRGHTTLPKCEVFTPIGDGAAGNIGSGADQLRVAAINIGTSAAVRTIARAGKGNGQNLPQGLFRYVVGPGRFLIGGATSNAGNLRQWCLREFRIDNDPRATEHMLSRQAAATDPLTVLPFWVEERAPTWPEGQLGVIDGLNQATTGDQIARAAATAVFYRLSQILEGIERSLGRMNRIVVSGGILRSRASTELLADALGRDLKISSEMEASLRGAAIHGLTQLGVKTPRLRTVRTVRHNRRLAARHRARRERQIELEKILRSRKLTDRSNR